MSLVTTPVSQLPVCAHCGSRSVTSLRMTLTDGAPVDFLSCHGCEARSWTEHGVELPLETVLAKVQKRKAA